MANFSVNDKGWLLCYNPNKTLGAYDESIIVATFEKETDVDIEYIVKIIERDRVLRKVCLVKILTFPLEYILIRLIIGKDKAKDRYNLHKLYKSFYKKTISFESLQKDLLKLSNSGKII